MTEAPELNANGENGVQARPQPQQPPTATVLVANPATGLASARERPRRSSKEKLRIAEYLDDRYGHACVECGRACSVPYGQRKNSLAQCLLETDHINGDKFDDRLKNLTWRCNPCNLAKRPLDKLNCSAGLGKRESQQVGAVNANSNPFESVTWEGRKNLRSQAPFRAWVVGKLVLNYPGGIGWEWFVETGAEIFDCMQVTTDRYLRKMTRKEAPSAPCYADVQQVGNEARRLVFLKQSFFATAGKQNATEEFDPPVGSEEAGP